MSPISVASIPSVVLCVIYQVPVPSQARDRPEDAVMGRTDWDPVCLEHSVLASGFLDISRPQHLLEPGLKHRLPGLTPKSDSIGVGPKNLHFFFFFQV